MEKSIFLSDLGRGTTVAQKECSEATCSSLSPLDEEYQQFVGKNEKKWHFTNRVVGGIWNILIYIHHKVVAINIKNTGKTTHKT